MILRFGKFKGKNISELPLDYLQWGAENLTKPTLKKSFKLELESRNQHKPKVETEPRRPNRQNLRVPKKKETTTNSGVSEGNIQKTEYNPLIFGKDKTENIVNITLANDKVYIYKSDGTVDIQDYKPFALSARKFNGSERLKGDQYYRYKTRVPLTRFKEMQKEWDKSKWLPRSPEEAFMVENGHTYFKGMTVDQVSLLSFDLETTGVDIEAEDAEVILISNTFRDKNGKVTKKLFDIKKYEDESDMIMDWHEFVREMNPDILLGHNILGFDLPYLNTRQTLTLGRNYEEVEVAEKPIKVTHAGLDFDFANMRIPGREIVDTMILSMKHDIANEFPSYGLKAIEEHLELVGDDRVLWDFEKYHTRDYKTWPEGKWEEFCQYCIDDADSPIQMFDIMAPAFFYLNQSVPKSFQDIINQRSGSQIDSMMVRSYLQNGYSQPRSSKKKKFKGAISMGVGGAHKNVRKFDVASLYPSIMLELNIHNKEKDPEMHMPKMLEYFREERLKNKAEAATGSQYHDDLQAAQKIVINSMYGFLGAGYLLYNDMEGAEAVTERGREILQIAVEWACGFRLVEEVKKIVNEGKENEKIHYHWVCGPKISEGLGYDLANVDTDAIAISNGIAPTKEEFNKQIDELNALYSKWIEWEDDGVFQNFIVVGAKNYVLQLHPTWCKPRDLDSEGVPKVKFKGSSIRDAKKEPRLRKFLMDVLDMFLKTDDDHEESTLRLYKRLCKDVLEFRDVSDWVVKKSVSKAILAAKTDPTVRPHESQPMAAITEAMDKGIIEAIQEGDKIWIYRALLGEKQQVIKGELQFSKMNKKQLAEAGVTEKLPLLESCDHKESLVCRDCNPAMYRPKMIKSAGYRFKELYEGDHDQDHYLNRAYDTLMVIENLIDKDKFYNYSKTKQKKYLEEIM